MFPVLKRAALAAGAGGALTLGLATPAAAHVTVNPDTATQGGYATVTFKVPNEANRADTTKLEVTLPADAPVASVSVRPVPGWTADVRKAALATPITVHGAQISEAVSKITWTAAPDAAIKPGQFQEFAVSLGPLPQVDRMVFKALQTYSNGTVVRWIDEPSAGGAEPEHPAPVVRLSPAAPAAVADAAGSGRGGTALGVAGIVLGLAGLVLGLLAYRRAGRAGSAATPPAPAEREPAGAL